MELLSIVSLLGGLVLAALVGVVVKHLFFPDRFEVEEMEFDLRAAKLPDDIAHDAQKFARTKALAKQRYTLNLNKPNKYKTIRAFFRR